MQGRAQPGRRPTSADVAREAGLSRATVSFVLNDAPGQTIPEATRQRVLDAAARLSYVPSAEARALSRGHSDVVLFALPSDLPLSVDAGAILEHLAAGFSGIGLTLLAQPWSESASGDVWQAITPVAVVGWQLGSTATAAMRRSGIRAVVSLAGSDPVGRWVQGAREDEIARTQVARLVDAGHRDLACATPADARLAGAAGLRVTALQRACAALGLPQPLATPVPPDADGAAQAVRAWRAPGVAVTGVCAHDDVTALAVLAGMRREGLSAPDDLAVIGVNDSPAARLADPPLTMVGVDPAATAQFVVEVVSRILGGRAMPRRGPSIAKVVERRSV